MGVGEGMSTVLEGCSPLKSDDLEVLSNNAFYDLSTVLTNFERGFKSRDCYKYITILLTINVYYFYDFYKCSNVFDFSIFLLMKPIYFTQIVACSILSQLSVKT